jgi:integrase/recombinase XerD
MASMPVSLYDHAVVPEGEAMPASAHARFWDRYRAHLLVEQRAPATIRHYHRTLALFWDFCGKQPSRCGPRDLRRFLDRRTTAVSAHGAVLADATRRSYAAVILAAYHWAYAAKLHRRDPMAGVRVPTVYPATRDPLDLGQVIALVAYSYAEPRTHLAVWVAFGCGVRVAELAGLRIEDCHLGARPHLRVHGKGRRERVVPLHPEVAGVLRLALVGRPQTGPVLESKTMPGRPISPHTVSEDLRVALRACGIRATPHQLRHTFAVELLAADAGRNIRAVSRLLGHASTETTERFYTCTYDADAWAAVQLLPDPRRPG